MRSFFVLLSAFVILLPAAFPQASDRTVRTQTGPVQSQGPSNPAIDEVLKRQLAGLTEGTAIPVQQPHVQSLSPAQVSPWTGPFAKIGPHGNGLDLGIRHRELSGTLPSPSKACAIPLLEMPVDSSLDEGIRIPQPMRSGSSADPKMAVLPPAPACDNQAAPLPKLKVK